MKRDHEANESERQISSIPPRHQNIRLQTLFLSITPSGQTRSFLVLVQVVVRIICQAVGTAVTATSLLAAESSESVAVAPSVAAAAPAHAGGVKEAV